MGEWSDYFEDFPEENSANYVGGRFDPPGAKAIRDQKAKLARDQTALNSEIAEIVKKHRKSTEQGKK
jgi:hypothetical protein